VKEKKGKNTGRKGSKGNRQYNGGRKRPQLGNALFLKKQKEKKEALEVKTRGGDRGGGGGGEGGKMQEERGKREKWL